MAMTLRQYLKGEAPKCKLCGARHLLSEPHAFLSKPIESRQDATKLMRNAVKLMPTGETRKHCKTCRCYPMTAAERQKAYRERHKP